MIPIDCYWFGPQSLFMKCTILPQGGRKRNNLVTILNIYIVKCIIIIHDMYNLSTRRKIWHFSIFMYLGAWLFLFANGCCFDCTPHVQSISNICLPDKLKTTMYYSVVVAQATKEKEAKLSISFTNATKQRYKQCTCVATILTCRSSPKSPDVIVSVTVLNGELGQQYKEKTSLKTTPIKDCTCLKADFYYVIIYREIMLHWMLFDVRRNQIDLDRDFGKA